MFWQETSFFSGNGRQTAYNVHLFNLLGQPSQTGLSFNFGGPETGRA